MNKITATQALLPMLKALHALGPNDGHLVPDVQTRVVADMGITATGDDFAKVKLAFASAAFELRQRGAMDNLKGPLRWILTDLGRDVATGAAPMPGPAKGPTKRVNASRKESAPATGNAPAAPADASSSAESSEGGEPDADSDSTAANEPTVIETAASEPASPAPSAPTPPAPSAPAVVAPSPVVTTAPALLAVVPDAPALSPVVAAVEQTENAPAPTTIAPAVESVDALADRIASGKRMKTASLSVLQNVPDWVSDPYLRQLVFVNHPCAGGWSPKDVVCGECVLAPSCRNAQAGVLGTLSVKLREAELSEAAKNLHAVTAAAMAPSAKRLTAELREGVPMSAPYDSVCAKTGAAITKGEQVLFVPKLGVVKAGV